MEEQKNTAGRTMSDAELEKKLKPYVTKLSLFSTLELISFVAIIIAVILVFIVGWTAIVAILLVAGIAVMILSMIVTGKTKAAYDEIFKQEMGPEIENIISSYIGPQLEQDMNAAKNRISAAVKKAGLWRDFDSCSPSAYRKGSLGDGTFEAFNAVLTKTVEVETVDNDGGKVKDHETKTLFNGTWLVVERKDRLTAPIMIREVGDKKERKDPYWNVTVGDQKFSDRFCVHAEETELAGNVLTQDFTQKLTALADLAGAESGFCLMEDRLYMAVNGGPKFQNMDGASTKHIEDIRGNLKTSMEYICKLVEGLQNIG